MARNESDSAWKNILDTYLKECLDFCLPELSRLIDWSKPYVSLDKELHAIIKGTKKDSRFADKLYKVYLKNGEKKLIFIHVEVQGEYDSEFTQRMFVYRYRIFDKYKKEIVSIAILTDDKKDWRPEKFQMGLPGAYLTSEFWTIKVLDFENRLHELENSKNPFASVILVQLKALQNKNKSDKDRKKFKIALTKQLLKRGLNRENIIHLLKFLDWLIGLPEELEIEYSNELFDLEETTMAYVTIESLAIKRGLEKGLQQGLEQGLQQGLEQGLEKGLEKGRIEGKLETELKIAKRLLTENYDPTIIAKITGLSLEKIEQLQEEKAIA